MKPRTRPFPTGENVLEYALNSGDKVLFSPGNHEADYYVAGLRCNDILTKIVPLNFGKVREVPEAERLKVRAGLWNYFKEQNPDASINYREFSVRFLPFFD